MAYDLSFGGIATAEEEGERVPVANVGGWFQAADIAAGVGRVHIVLRRNVVTVAKFGLEGKSAGQVFDRDYFEQFRDEQDDEFERF